MLTFTHILIYFFSSSTFQAQFSVINHFLNDFLAFLEFKFLPLISSQCGSYDDDVCLKLRFFEILIHLGITLVLQKCLRNLSRNFVNNFPKTIELKSLILILKPYMRKKTKKSLALND